MLESGQSIANYQIIKPLNENQLFTTYEVVSSDNASAKLLEIKPDVLAEKKVRLDFLARAGKLRELNFLGLKSLLAAGADDELCYCVFPIPIGSPLAESLSKRYSVRQSLEMVRKLALFLTAPHDAGFWHGAISPATVYLDGETLSMDQFALASLLRLDFHSGIDPCYSSPELVRGEEPGPAGDVYSLGILLYRLLTGGVPFCQDDPFATAMQHVQQQVPALPDPLDRLQPLLDGLLSATPDERWSAMKLVAQIDSLLMAPDIDSLFLPEAAPATEPVEVEEVASQPSAVERLAERSEMSERIEQRLRERAEILQKSSDLTQDAKRASTARMSAIGQQSYRKNKRMNRKGYHQQTGPRRFLPLVVLGTVVGVIIYLLLFASQPTQQLSGQDLPNQLLDGLEQGSQLLAAGQLDKAEQVFVALSENYQLYPQPYNNLAAVYAQRGDLEKSRSFLERAMATDNSYAAVYRNLGTVYSEMARDSYGRALQLGNGQQAVTLQVFGASELLAFNTSSKVDKAKTTPAAVAEKPAATGSVVAAAEPKQEPAPAPQKTAGPETATTEKAEAEVPVVAAVDQAAVEPIIETILTPEPEAAETFLGRWAAAWSAQDVAAYIGFYAEDFTPAAGSSREAWAKQRRSRITRPASIEVQLEDFSLVRQTGERLQIEVTQSYKSDRYADRTRKLFDLVRQDGSWKITRERSLGRVR